ncbi:MAG TPA: hypothetical protein VI454_08265 [Verrucomicrobiae bacterium]|jgi:hypothetical protein
MITNDEQLEKAEQAVRTLKDLLRRSRQTMSSGAYAQMSRAWLLELQQREREILVYLSGFEMPQTAAS